MNRDDVHTRQLPVQRKMLNPNRFRHPDAGKIWTLVEYWTIQPRRFGRGGDGAVAAGLSVRQIEFPQERGVSRVASQALHQGIHFHSAQTAATLDVRPV